VQISIPRQVIASNYGSATGRIWRYSRDGFNGFIPLILDDYPVDAPTHFRESHGLTNNYVCHGKIVSFSGGDIEFGNAIMSYDGKQYVAQVSGYVKDTYPSYSYDSRLSMMWDTYRGYMPEFQRRVPILGTMVTSVRYTKKGIFYAPNVVNGGAITLHYRSCVLEGSKLYHNQTNLSINYSYKSTSKKVELIVNNVGPNLPYKKGDKLGTLDIDSSKLFTSKTECFDYIEGIVVAAGKRFLRDGIPKKSTGVISVTRYMCGGALLPNPGRMFLFNEPDDLFLMGPREYWLKYLCQTAYVDALQSAPKMNDNNLQNIAEVASFIYNLVVKHRIEIPHGLQDAWLSYRYVYNTGKSDVNDAIAFMRRTHDLAKITGPLKCHGMSYTTAVEDTNVTCRCSLSLQQKELSRLRRIWDQLATYGLTPNFYVLWDFIPYSFIVDWLIPVGDMLNVTDTFNRFNKNYTISDVCFSLKYRRADDAGYQYQLYYRWPSSPLESLNEFYWTEKPDPSARTTLYRILDSVSLVTS
jgi:hypothetical protein